MLLDKHKRHITYLRVSVTDRCNLRCIYCIPNKYIPRLKHHDILTYEEMLRIIKVFVELGIRKVRITGGEPFVRKGIDFFIRELSKISKIRELVLTTNAILLKDYIEILKISKIKRINISLDTLKPERYKEITGYDGFYKVWESIYKAKEAGFSPIRINVVVLKGINDDEVFDFARLSINEPFHIRFIEYMPIGPEKTDLSYIPGNKIKNMLTNKIGKLIEIEDKTSLYPGPARYFKFEGAKGIIGFIDPISSHFCGTCDRIRLTADGHLKPCLLSPYKLDIKTSIRSGISDKELKKIIINTISHKPATYPSIHPIKDSMSFIGG